MLVARDNNDTRSSSGSATLASNMRSACANSVRGGRARSASNNASRARGRGARETTLFTAASQTEEREHRAEIFVAELLDGKWRHGAAHAEEAAVAHLLDDDDVEREVHLLRE